MGLSGNFTDPKTGVTISDAYFRICTMSIGKDLVTCVLDCWNSQDDRAFEFHEDKSLRKSWIVQRAYDIEILRNEDGSYKNTEVDTNNVVVGEVVPNFFVQAYNYLKTLPEYENCIDA